MDVDLTARAERYGPGDQATVDIRTRTASGRPVSATVVLRAVDEKLFAIGAAEEADPLSELYASFGSGVIATYASHGLPSDRDPGDTAGGDTGGGDDGSRSEFVDSLLFRAVDTDAQGRATVTFRLSDDLTSWHVSAAAFSTALEAGSSATLVPVGLPFFADVVVAPEYLVADRPAIQVNTYGSDLQAGAKVAITVESSSLGLRTGSLAARAFEPLTVRLPRLTPGLHTVTITATSGRGAAALRDRLTRTFLVVESRLTRSRTSSVTLGSTGDRPDGGQGLTTYLVSDAGRGRYLATLLDLAADQGARLDQALAADLARSLLKDELGTEAGSLPTSEFSPRSTPRGAMRGSPCCRTRAVTCSSPRWSPGGAWSHRRRRPGALPGDDRQRRRGDQGTAGLRAGWPGRAPASRPAGDPCPRRPDGSDHPRASHGRACRGGDRGRSDRTIDRAIVGRCLSRDDRDQRSDFGSGRRPRT